MNPPDTTRLLEVEAATEALCSSDQRVLLNWIEQRVHREHSGKSVKRVPELHSGVWDVSDDFDDSLPDAFWLGSDA